MSLDIHSAVQAAIALAIIGIVLSIWIGIRSIRRAHTLRFFRMRRARMVYGWRMIFFAIFLGGLALILRQFAEPAIYRFFPPTATLTLTPTTTPIPTTTATPSITLTPTITLTPSESDTPTITPTPHVPLAIEVEFESSVTPNADAVFSNLIFAQKIDETYQPVNPNTVFQNPVGDMYALFSYDGMLEKSQWTALWYRNGELVHYETKPWDGGTGGFGYTDWHPQPHEWLPGVYEVQIFNGTIWKVSGQFSVEGEAPTPPASATPTLSATPSPTITLTPTPLTPTLSPTPRPSYTPTPSRTPWPTATPLTPTPSRTPWPTATPLTPSPTSTPWPTRTPTVVPTQWPTATPLTPSPTLTRQPLATNTPVTPTITRHPTAMP